MGVSRRSIKGSKCWVIDRRFYAADGRSERYRRVAQVQTRPGAEAEERDVIAYWTKHGTITPLLKGEVSAPAGSETKTDDTPKSDDNDPPTWDDAVKHHAAVEMPKLKPSTQKGYEVLLDGPGMARWKSVRLAEITYAEIVKWDTALVKTGNSASTRRNHHIVLRSVLRSVGPTDDGEPGVLLQGLPRYPKLPKVGRTVVEAASPEDVKLLLSEEDDEERQLYWSKQRRAARLCFALASYAGLRAGEVRALRRRDVDLKRKVITVRLARCNGVEAAPKSGHEREVPIAEPLYLLLVERCEGLQPDAYVAVKADGEPWGDRGIWRAFCRACERLGITGGRYHGLRHYFATRLFAGAADARTVQALLGHASLEVTQRYAHHQADRARAAMGVFSAQA